jgi:hypothetical protein
MNTSSLSKPTSTLVSIGYDDPLENSEPNNSDQLTTSTELAKPPDTNIVKGRKPVLVTLPPEIHLIIFRYLDRCSSTCLALASKRLYPIHKSIRGTRIPLAAYCTLADNKTGKHLYKLIWDWMGEDMFYDELDMKFCTEERAVMKKEAFNFGGLNKAKYEAFKIRCQDFMEAGGYWNMGVWYDWPRIGERKSTKCSS